MLLSGLALGAYVVRRLAGDGSRQATEGRRGRSARPHYGRRGLASTARDRARRRPGRLYPLELYFYEVSPAPLLDAAHRSTGNRPTQTDDAPERDRGHREPGRARDGEAELRAADLAEPAGEQAADRREAREGPQVEADDAAAQVVGRAELQDRVRVRRPEREADAGDEEEHRARPDRRQRREREQRDAEAAGAEHEHLPARAAERRREERADQRAAAEAGGEDAEHLRARRPACRRRAAAGSRGS